jgi:diacylglycerol diphosphate phosphatase/phosphatidate phosphatase
LGYALSTSTLFINLVKIFVGGLRPHFLTLCEPMVINYPPGTPPHYYTAEHICMGDESLLKEAQMSFPSGHACAAFAGFVFLAFFLNAQLKTFGFGRTLGFCQPHDGGSGIIAHWKLLAFILPWCCATILAASKVRDGWHHPIDVVVGAMVGTAFATMAYAMSYRSVWDPATNHIPW